MVMSSWHSSLNTLQDSGEKTSAYLHRLQTVLNQAVRRGGVAVDEADRHLLKQLCRGCWDTALLLKLEPLKNTSPSFADLLLLLRGEEDKEASRAVRMRQHLGTAKSRASTCAQSMHAGEDETGVASLQKQIYELQGQFATLISLRQEKGVPNPTKTAVKKPSRLTDESVEARVNSNRVEAAEIGELKKQIADLQAQVANTRAPRHQHERSARSSGLPAKAGSTPTALNASELPRHGGPTTYRPRPGYCFRCGEDRHLAINCENVPNSLKVEEKRRQLRDAQARWDLQNNVAHTPHSN